MKNLWKKISAVAISAVMLISATAQAAVTANRIDSTDNAMAVEFYGNDGTTVTGPAPDYIVWAKEEVSDAPLGGSAIKLEVPASASSEWMERKLDFASTGDISAYRENGYFGMWLKVVTEADEYAFRWNFWEHPDDSTWTNLSTSKDNCGEVVNSKDYINKWAFISIDVDTMCSNPKATLNDVYESAMQFVFTTKAATIYVQGLGIYTPSVTTETDGLSTKLTWTPVENATRYEVKRDTNFDGSFGDVLTSNCTDTTFTDTTVPAEGVYQYAVKAYNGETQIGNARFIYANVIGEKLEKVASISNARDTWNTNDSDAAPLGKTKLTTSEKKAIIDCSGKTDLTQYISNGYLGFYLKSDAAVDWKIELSNGDAYGWARSRYTVNGSDMTSGRWQFVKIKLSDFVPDGFNNSALELIVFLQDSECKKEIQGLGIYVSTGAKLDVSTTVNGGSVKLDYTLSVEEAAKYEIYRNGEKIADTTETTYTDTPERGTIHYYTVKAFDADGAEITLGEAVAGVRAANENVLVDVYGNGSSASVNNGLVAAAKSSPMGGSYISKSAGKDTVAINVTSDWSSVSDSDYIEFYYYYKTETPKTFMLEVYSDGWKSANWAVDGENAVSGKWNIARIKVGDYKYKSGEFDFSKIIQVKLSDVGNAEIAWQGIRIVEGPKNVNITDVDFESDNTGTDPDWDAAEKVYVTVSVNNETSSSVTPVVFAAFYDGDTFKGVSIINSTTAVDAKKSGTIEGEFTIPEKLAKPTVRVMVWDSLSGMIPYSTVYGNASAE